MTVLTTPQIRRVCAARRRRGWNACKARRESHKSGGRHETVERDCTADRGDDGGVGILERFLHSSNDSIITLETAILALLTTWRENFAKYRCADRSGRCRMFGAEIPADTSERLTPDSPACRQPPGRGIEFQHFAGLEPAPQPSVE